MKLKVTNYGRSITAIEAAHLIGTNTERLSRRLARMKRRNPKLETVTVQRLLELTKKHATHKIGDSY